MVHSVFQRIIGASREVRPLMSADGAMTSQRKAAIHCIKKGINCYNSREYIEAERIFREAVAQDPGYARAHCYLGNALHKMGQPEEAMIEWKKAVIVEPDSESAVKARAKMERVASQNRSLVRALEERLGMRNQQF